MTAATPTVGWYALALVGGTSLGLFWAWRVLKSEARGADSEAAPDLGNRILTLAQRYVLPGFLPLVISGGAILLFWGAEKTPALGACWIGSLVVGFLLAHEVVIRSLAGSVGSTAGLKELEAAQNQLHKLARSEMYRHGYTSAKKAVRQRVRLLKTDVIFRQKLEAQKKKTRDAEAAAKGLRNELADRDGELKRRDLELASLKARFDRGGHAVADLAGIVSAACSMDFVGGEKDRQLRHLAALLGELVNAVARSVGNPESVAAAIFFDDNRRQSLMPFAFSHDTTDDVVGGAKYWLQRGGLRRDDSVLHACRILRRIFSWPSDRDKLDGLGIAVPKKSNEDWPKCYVLPLPAMDGPVSPEIVAEQEVYGFLVVRLGESVIPEVEAIRYALLAAGVADVLVGLLDPGRRVRS